MKRRKEGADDDNGDDANDSGEGDKQRKMTSMMLTPTARPITSRKHKYTGCRMTNARILAKLESPEIKAT